jgi:hypothetical protein
MLAADRVPIILSTDAQSVMSTSLGEEYQHAKRVLQEFRGDPEKGVKGLGTMPVTKETYLQAHPHVDPATVHEPIELPYNELPSSMKESIDTAYKRMIDDANARRANVEAADKNDTRRAGESE